VISGRARIGVVAGALVLALAGCGKVGNPEQPAGGLYPRVYPLQTLGRPTQSSIVPESPSSVQPITKAEPGITPPVQPTGPSFTANGAWIDPVVRRPSIDPNADHEGPNGPNGP